MAAHADLVPVRWWTPDPAGLAAVAPANPQSWNRYSYVYNNPLRYTDPLGLRPCNNAKLDKPGDDKTRVGGPHEDDDSADAAEDDCNGNPWQACSLDGVQMDCGLMGDFLRPKPGEPNREIYGDRRSLGRSPWRGRGLHCGRDFRRGVHTRGDRNTGGRLGRARWRRRRGNTGQCFRHRERSSLRRPRRLQLRSAMNIAIRRKLGSWARLRRSALYWGLPFTVLELIGAPFGPMVFIFAVPIFLAATAIAYFTDLAIVKLGEKLSGPSPPPR